MTNETAQGLERLSWLPDRDSGDNGLYIAGQKYYDIFFTGGTITGVDISGGTVSATNIQITNDTTTNATMYPVWVNANSGNLLAKVTSTKLTYNPSTATFNSIGKLIASSSSASAQTINSIAPSVQVLSTSATNAAATIMCYSNDALGGLLQIGKSRGETIGSVTTVQLNDTYGSISFVGANGSTFSEGGRIEVTASNTISAPETPGFMRFSVTADGATTATQQLVLDSAGRLSLKNNATVQTIGALAPRLQVAGTSTTGHIANQNFSADSTGAELFFTKSRNSTVNSHTIVQNGDTIGGITFSGSNGTTYDTAARIYSIVDGAPGASSDMPGALIFQTTANGSSALTTHLTLDNTGLLSLVGTLASPVMSISSPASNDDPVEVTYQNKVTTTDATTTTIATIPIPSSTTVMVEARVVARRTGGSSGTAQDGAGYIIAAAYKNVAGTATEIGEGSIFSAEDQSAWTCTVTASGSNALIQVTGAANNNVSWSITYRVYTVST